MVPGWWGFKSCSLIKLGPARIVWLVVILGLCANLALYLAGAYRCIAYPYQIDYGEGAHLDRARELAEGRTIYPAIDHYPYKVDNYPPVYDLLCSFLVRASGVSFWGGRTISVVSAMLVSLLVGVMAAAQTGRKCYGAIAALLFPAAAGVAYWSVLYRVDMLGLLLSLAGLALVIRYEGTDRVLLATPMFLLSLYARQSLIAAPLSTFAYLLGRDRRRATIMIASLLASSALTFLALNAATSGQFYLHIVKYTATTFIPIRALQQYLKFARSHPAFLVLATTYTIYALSRRRNSLIVNYFILSGLIALTAGKVGSSVNYFLEVIAASCILTGLLVNGLETEMQAGKDGMEARSAASMLVATLLLFQLVAYANPPLPPPEAERDACLEVSGYIRNASGMIISEDTGLLVVNGKSIVLDPWIMTQLAKQGLWDQSTLIRDIEAKAFSLIVLRFDLEGQPSGRFTAQAAEAMRENYTLLNKSGDFWIYGPGS